MNNALLLLNYFCFSLRLHSKFQVILADHVFLSFELEIICFHFVMEHPVVIALA